MNWNIFRRVNDLELAQMNANVRIKQLLAEVEQLRALCKPVKPIKPAPGVSTESADKAAKRRAYQRARYAAKRAQEKQQ